MYFIIFVIVNIVFSGLFITALNKYKEEKKLNFHKKNIESRNESLLLAAEAQEELDEAAYLNRAFKELHKETEKEVYPNLKDLKFYKEKEKEKVNKEVREWVKSGIENQFILYLNKFYPGIGFGHERTEDYKKVLYKNLSYLNLRKKAISKITKDLKVKPELEKFLKNTLEFTSFCLVYETGVLAVKENGITIQLVRGDSDLVEFLVNRYGFFSILFQNDYFI